MKAYFFIEVNLLGCNSNYMYVSLDDDALELLVVGDLVESLSQLLLGLGTRPQRELEAIL